MVKTSKMELFRISKLFGRDRLLPRKKNYLEEEDFRYDLKANPRIVVFGNRIWCESQAMCYREFVRDVVNKIVAFRELN